MGKYYPKKKTNPNEEKRTVADVMIDTFLRDVDSTGQMPWQRPYERYNAFNYFTKKPYRGINRLILPAGEYMTKNQVSRYNIEKGYVFQNGSSWEKTPEAFIMQKGIEWLPVVYYSRKEYPASVEEIQELFPGYERTGKKTYIGTGKGWVWFEVQDGFKKQKTILKYFSVADRRHFRNEKGEMLPSRITTGEVVITKQEPLKVFLNYVDREGIKVDMTGNGRTPCYIPMFDQVVLNPLQKNEDTWFSTAFHELGHSTGHKSRLNRDLSGPQGSDEYAVEECVAEICASLCCAETGIHDFKTSSSLTYDNSIAYVQSWKKRVKDWGGRFIYIVSEADKAFDYICGADSNSEDEEGGEIDSEE